jgi:hypothetical protein
MRVSGERKTMRRTLAFLLALSTLAMGPDVRADRSQLIRLLDASFKCSPERERLEAESASYDVKYQYRFFAEDAALRIVTHYLAVGLEFSAKRVRLVEQRLVARARFSDIEVFRSRDPAFDRTVYISCTTDRPCISTSLMLDRSTPTSPEHAANVEEVPVEVSRKVDSFAVSYHLCDPQVAEYIRAGLSEIVTQVQAGEGLTSTASGTALRPLPSRRR